MRDIKLTYGPDFERDEQELEAFAVFCVCVTQKDADVTKAAVLRFLEAGFHRNAQAGRWSGLS